MPLRLSRTCVWPDYQRSQCHIRTRLPDSTPVHQAMLRQVELSVGRPPDPSWKRPPGRPRTKWTDQLRRDNNNVRCSHCDSVEASHWSRPLESDATFRADYALTTTTTTPPVAIGSSVLCMRCGLTTMSTPN